MKLEYFVKKKTFRNFKNSEVETKYVPELLKKTPATIESLCAEIEIGSTLSRHEAALALEEWSDVAIDALTHGRAVQVGKLGTLRLRLEVKAQNSPEDVNSKCIKNVKCVFYPSMKLTRRIKEVPIHKRDYMPKAVINSQDEN